MLCKRKKLSALFLQMRVHNRNFEGDSHCYIMAYLHCQIWTRIQTPNPMATLHYVEFFTLYAIGFTFQSQLPTKGMESESVSIPESVSGNVNEPLPDSLDDNIYSELIIHRASSLQQPRRLLSKLSSVCGLLCTIKKFE